MSELSPSVILDQLSTCGGRMRYAARVIREVNDRYGMPATTGAWSPEELDSESKTADAVDAERAQEIQQIAAVIEDSLRGNMPLAERLAAQIYDAGWRNS